MAFDGKGGFVFHGEEARRVANDLLGKSAASAKTGSTYEGIGYRGHAAMARHQSDVLAASAAKVLRGEPVSGFEMEEYKG